MCGPVLAHLSSTAPVQPVVSTLPQLLPVYVWQQFRGPCFSPRALRISQPLPPFLPSIQCKMPVYPENVHSHQKELSGDSPSKLSCPGLSSTVALFPSSFLSRQFIQWRRPDGQTCGE